MKTIGFYDVHIMGKFNGKGPDLYSFNLYRPDGSYGSSHVVEESEAAKTREAFIAMGYVSKGVK